MGLFSSIASVVGSVGDILTGNSASSKNKREAQRQRDWQTYMSDTAHQREVADLEAAGLNPILTATGGSGASTGSSGLASAVSANGAFGNGISNALKGYKASAEKKLLEAQADNLDSVTEKNFADANLARVTAQNSATMLPEQVATVRAQRGMYDAQALYSKQNALLAALNLPQAEATAKMYQSTYGQLLPYLTSGVGLANSFTDIIKPFRGYKSTTETTTHDGNGVIRGGSYRVYRSNRHY